MDGTPLLEEASKAACASSIVETRTSSIMISHAPLMQEPLHRGAWFYGAKKQPSIMSCETEAGGPMHGEVESSEVYAFFKSLKVQVWGHVNGGHIMFANHELQNNLQGA